MSAASSTQSKKNKVGGKGGWRLNMVGGKAGRRRTKLLRRMSLHKLVLSLKCITRLWFALKTEKSREKGSRTAQKRNGAA
eukprot:CAMPEP_0119371400 /NCGR_PEP_ID=MMETSP1334-20130426/17568_1 /TAXON_ID=127549 /ORGANISM="Calcidiscus leptoporus, Strain RCC1130" /LENGTH=79 /DNA_ID=CAMNT_0007388657 /DNA_START=353 /DNA_END=592 /DNA_ORIENTATION=+